MGSIRVAGVVGIAFKIQSSARKLDAYAAHHARKGWMPWLAAGKLRCHAVRGSSSSARVQRASRFILASGDVCAPPCACQCGFDSVLSGTAQLTHERMSVCEAICTTSMIYIIAFTIYFSTLHFYLMLMHSCSVFYSRVILKTKSVILIAIIAS